MLSIVYLTMTLWNCSRVHHCTPPNHSKQHRTMINIRYAPRWLFPLNSFRHLGQPPWPPLPTEVLANLPRKARPFYTHAVKAPEEQEAPSHPERGIVV